MFRVHSGLPVFRSAFFGAIQTILLPFSRLNFSLFRATLIIPRQHGLACSGSSCIRRDTAVVLVVNDVLFSAPRTVGVEHVVQVVRIGKGNEIERGDEPSFSRPCGFGDPGSLAVSGGCSLSGLRFRGVCDSGEGIM